MLARPSATQTMSDANEGNAGGRPRDPRRGLVLMFLGLALFSILNAVVKAQAETFPVNQIVFFRNAGGAVALVIVLAWLGEAFRIKLRELPLNLLQMAVMTSGILLTLHGLSPDAARRRDGDRLHPADRRCGRFGRLSSRADQRLRLDRRRARPPGSSTGHRAVRRSGSVLGLGALAAAGGTICSAASMMLQRTLTAHQSPLLITVSFMTLSSLALLPSLAVSWVRADRLAPARVDRDGAGLRPAPATHGQRALSCERSDRRSDELHQHALGDPHRLRLVRRRADALRCWPAPPS